MHAAPSVILFTVLSGAGFGYLAFLGLGPTGTGWTGFLQFALAYLLAVGGLLASTFHLGNPQRSLKAFTQWRTSWLSREAWASVVTLVVMGLVGAAAVFLGERLAVLGLVGAVLALVTVFATSMIYAQLKTVPRWNSALTPLYFLATSLAGGAILSGRARLAALLLLLLGVAQLAAWLAGDGRFAARGHSLATATGLGGLGRLRLFESPHTGTNYLLNEFVHEVGRRHAVKLRVIALLAMCLVPAALLLLPSPSLPIIAVAFALHLAGAFASRWLFFAEAEHVVRLYYGRT
jgi:DMSO reductase anchor subunit